jgi:hypothetical protein
VAAEGTSRPHYALITYNLITIIINFSFSLICVRAITPTFLSGVKLGGIPGKNMKLKLFENEMLRRIFTRKMEGTVDCEKVHNLCSSPAIIWAIKLKTMR